MADHPCPPSRSGQGSLDERDSGTFGRSVILPVNDMSATLDYDAGDVIVYQTFGGGLRRVRVEQRLANVKRGRPGFDGVVVSGPEKGKPVWGYDDQIVPLRLVAGTAGLRAELAAVEDSSPGAA